MLTVNKILQAYHSEIPQFRVCSDTHPCHDTPTRKLFKQPHVSNHYYFYYLAKGQSHHQIDLQHLEMPAGNLIFVCPHQIHFPQYDATHNTFFKLYFEEENQFLLKESFAFLNNPLQSNFIHFSSESQQRIEQIFKVLLQLQNNTTPSKSLSLSYLNVLLEEFNLAYFASTKTPVKTQDILHFTAFKAYLNKNLSLMLSIEQVAQDLGISSSLLYKIVKRTTQKSPKEYLTSLLIIEAQRRLLYSPVSTKELAYDLGFSDPSYFSRVFKKYTGKSIRKFITDLSI